MSYNARVFNVMIASPGDVSAERQIVRNIIYEWNTVHSESRNIVLLPVGWETHSSPEMGDTPQAIINNQILDKCDFLVGIFGTRIGTRTKDYISGAVEEIERHIKSGKPAMLYFSKKPLERDTLNMDQYTELENFRNSCKDRGLYETYNNEEDFTKKFYRHLQLKLNEHPIFKEITPELIDNNSQPNNLGTSLTDDARILLKEVSLDSTGKIFISNYFGISDTDAGVSFITNNKDFTQGKEQREVAKWEAALKELSDNNLVSQLDSKGKRFKITDKGYKIADKIN